MSAKPIFKRTDLAIKMTAQILSDGIGAVSSSGLFLAAPRRTGKSTFLREDLRPQLTANGVIVLYADLWADRSADPGQVIIGAIRAELSKYDGLIKRLAHAAGMDKVNVGRLGFSLDRVGLGGDITMSDALAELSAETSKTIVLIIDEAQHAITTQDGYNTLFALKAARDELNSSQYHGLRIVATGSNRDKLAMLRNSKDQAFYLVPLVPFPPLGKDYVQWFCQRAPLPTPLDPAVVFELFRRASYRPEILDAAINALRFNFSEQPNGDSNRAFSTAVEIQCEADDKIALSVFHALTPLQSAVLRVLAARGDQYAPFEQATIETYQTVLSAIAPNESVKPVGANVQQALSALQDKSLVWRERRGVYALEESALAELLAANGFLDVVPAQTW